MCSFCDQAAFQPGNFNAEDGSPLAGNGQNFDTRTGDNNIDGLLIGTSWNTTALTFAFPAANTYFTQPYVVELDSNGNPVVDNSYVTNFQALNASWQTASRSILTQYAAVTNVNFTEVSTTTQADLVFAMTNSTNVSTANGRFPSYTVNEGHQWYRVSNYDATPQIGTYTWATILHETGHTMGLAHGHSADSITNIPGVVMNADRDSMEFSIMTYRSYVGASTSGGYTNEQFGFAQTLMMYDIAALQHMYGADYTTNSGANVYTFNTTTGEMSIDGIGQGTPGGNRIFRTVWDGGGSDTYNLSNYTTNLDIDLTPGSWSTFSAAQLANLGNGNFARANLFNALLSNGDARGLIENATGGTGNDTIEGNRASNTLIGNSGMDTLFGAGGSDYLYGGNDNDTIYGDGQISAPNTIGFGSGLHSHANVYDSAALAFNITNLFSVAADSDITNSTTVPHVTLRYSDSAAGQKQFYKVLLVAGSVITVDVDGTSLDSIVYIYGADGITQLASNDDGSIDPGSTTAINSFLTYTVPTNGYYYIAIDSFYSVGSLPAISYDLHISVQYNPIARGEDGSAGNDFIYGGSGEDTIYGGDGSDVIYGSSLAADLTDGDDVIYGNLGNDTISANAGNDTIHGGSGGDTVYGGSGNDVIYGSSIAADPTDGDDVIYGNLGNDTLNGNAGADSFVFNTTLNASTNVDTIMDFAVGVDDIVLSRAIFTQIGTGLDGFEFQLGTAANDSGDRIIYNQATGQLFYDANGNINGAADQILFATVTANTALTISDFVMVA